MHQKKIILLATTLFLLASANAQYSLADFISKNTFSCKRFGDIHLSAEDNFFYKMAENYIIKYSFQTGNIVDTVLNTNVPELKPFGYFR